MPGTSHLKSSFIKAPKPEYSLNTNTRLAKSALCLVHVDDTSNFSMFIEIKTKNQKEGILS